MRFSSLVCCLPLLSSALALYIPSLEEAGDAIEKRADIVATTGIPGATYPRLEVRQMLFNKPNQWTLFILAMQKFQQKAQNDATSFYQIAGIHGVPRQNYNGVGQCSTCGGTDGYCPHDSILFPGWHRAYIALFEQQFKTVVDQIAASYPASQRPAMQGAASTIRFPYWDWAAHPAAGYPTLPRVVSDKFMTVNGPTGQVTIINPLFRHDFSDTSGLVYSPFVNWKVTLRYPNSNANTASSVEQSAINGFERIRANLQDQVYQLFSTCKDYLHFSNDDAGSSSTSCSNSLEGIHNTIHTTAGGPGSSTASAGHMTYLATSAFDPIFWLHHCNVDRLFALWQNQYPNAWSGSQVAPHNTWTVAAGSTQGLDSPLTPFYKDTSGSKFWTTNQVRDTKTFHYTYPEFSNSDGSQKAIASYINKLYGPSATATAGSSKRTAAPEPVAASGVVPTVNSEASELVARDDTPLKADNGSLFQYVANIQAPRYALNGSYYIYLFQGEPNSENPADWIEDENLIGPMGVLAQPDMTDKNLIAAGSIPITRSLTNAVVGGLLADLTELTAVPFLKNTLAWRVAANGTSIDPGTIENFQIAVFGSTASQPLDAFSLPEWSEFIPLVDITQDKSGGANTTLDSVISGLTDLVS
ncbi:Di-copper centre-containing protein [Hortaea werneckii]|nr:Di-copper centre-containing protein [Hortaea werneckii]